jgi:hypothetical protein
MTYLKRYIALLLLCGILTQCQFLGFELEKQNKPEELPPITQEGKNTFGCYVNGNLFIPRGPTPIFVPKLKKTHDNYNTLTITVNSYRDSAGITISESMGFFLKDIKEEGVYTLKLTDIFGEGYLSSPINYLKSIGDSPSICYFKNSNHDIAGNITITKLNKDPKNYFISGTFEFTLTMSKPGYCDIPILKVTQGRFDLK